MFSMWCSRKSDPFLNWPGFQPHNLSCDTSLLPNSTSIPLELCPNLSDVLRSILSSIHDRPCMQGLSFWCNLWVTSFKNIIAFPCHPPSYQLQSPVEHSCVAPQKHVPLVSQSRLTPAPCSCPSFSTLPLAIFHLSEVTLGEQMMGLSSLLCLGSLEGQLQKAGSNYCASWMTLRV